MASTSSNTAASSLRRAESFTTEAFKKPGGEIRHLERGENLSTMNEVDEDIARYTDEDLVIKPEEERKIRRKIALHVLVPMLGTYFVQSLDKASLSFASIMGIRNDAKLVGQQYSWLTTCVYLAILVCELPQNWAIQRLPVARWYSTMIICWGITVAASAAVSNFTGLVILRTLLGSFECVIQPAHIFLVSAWFKKGEQAGATSLWYAMNAVQTAVGGLLALAFFQIQGAALRSWQIMFLVLGLCTICWGIFVMFWLPDSPVKSARHFNDRERTILVERVRANNTGIQGRKWRWDHVCEALTDPQVWALVLIQLANTIPTGGLGAYSNIIITQNLGFSVLQADLLSVAQGAIQLCVLLGSAWIATKTNQTLLVMAAFTLPNIASAVCFLTVPNDKAHSVGLLLAFYCTIFFNAQAPLSFSLLTRNVAGGTKKSVATAMTFAAWATGNAIGPQVFQAKDAPRYRNAFIGQLICYCFSIGLFFLLRVYYQRQNITKRRELRAAQRSEAGQTAAVDEDNDDDSPVEETHKNAFKDWTDRRNPELLYSY